MALVVNVHLSGREFPEVFNGVARLVAATRRGIRAIHQHFSTEAQVRKMEEEHQTQMTTIGKLKSVMDEGQWDLLVYAAEEVLSAQTDYYRNKDKFQVGQERKACKRIKADERAFRRLVLITSNAARHNLNTEQESGRVWQKYLERAAAHLNDVAGAQGDSALDLAADITVILENPGLTRQQLDALKERMIADIKGGVAPDKRAGQAAPARSNAHAEQAADLIFKAADGLKEDEGRSIHAVAEEVTEQFGL